MPEKPVCSICNGAEVVYVNDTDVETCRCLKARLVKQHLGPEIASAPTILQSPLLKVVEDAVVLDRTQENLFIKAPWVDVLPHLKWVFYAKGTRFRFRIITDEKIKTVFVGAESYMSRPKGKRDDVIPINSLNDLVGSDYDLVIIRLGFLGHKNVAAPGALKEALMIREVACRPTWIVEMPTNIFGYGCPTYSDDVADYIERHFEVLNLTRTDRPVPQPLPPELDEDVTGMEDPSEMPPLPISAAQAPRVHTPPSSVGDYIMDHLMGGDNRKKGGWKKKSGGGPV